MSYKKIVQEFMEDIDNEEIVENKKDLVINKEWANTHEDWVDKEIFGTSERDGWREIGNDVGDKAAEWMVNKIGYLPREKDLKNVFMEEKGLLILMRRVWDQPYNRRYQEKYYKEKK